MLNQIKKADRIVDFNTDKTMRVITEEQFNWLIEQAGSVEKLEKALKKYEVNKKRQEEKY